MRERILYDRGKLPRVQDDGHLPSLGDGDRAGVAVGHGGIALLRPAQQVRGDEVAPALRARRMLDCL